MINKFKTEQLEFGFDFDIELDKEQKLYCFIGENGIGKTQLLENMAKALIFSHSLFSDPQNNLKFSGQFMQKGVYDKIKSLEMRLPLGIEVNGTSIKNKNKKWAYTTLEHIRGHQSPSFKCDKPIVFIGAKNRGFTKNIDTDNIKILGDSKARFVESISRSLSYINSHGLKHEEVADWFVSRLIVNPNFVRAEQNKTNEVVAVLKLIEKLEPSYKLVQKNEQGGDSLSVIFHEGQLFINHIPIDKLSTGFVSIIKIFQEIIAGYGGWDGISDLTQVDGIVFIDEIEPHLHIKWQTRIINILKEVFPNTTFYISTHSPLVLSGLKDGEAYEITNVKGVVGASKINNVDDYFINDMINEFFGVDLNKERIANPNKEKQKQARKLLLNLSHSLDEDDNQDKGEEK